MPDLFKFVVESDFADDDLEMKNPNTTNHYSDSKAKLSDNGLIYIWNDEVQENVVLKDSVISGCVSSYPVVFVVALNGKKITCFVETDNALHLEGIFKGARKYSIMP
jgi:hypothetical protein